MSRRCEDCAASLAGKPDYFTRCTTCHFEHKREEELDDAYQRGYEDGVASARTVLDKRLLRKTLRLVHPDVVDERRRDVASEVTRELLDLGRAA